MPYTVDNYNRTKSVVIEDGTVNNSLDILLIGKNYSGYGELQNENFVYLLENFAGIYPPNKPLNGQLWYDSNSKKIKFYDSTVLKWKVVGGAESSFEPPLGLSIGDLWFDSRNNQLYVFNGDTYILIGPQGIPGLGTTEMQTRTLKDINNVEYPVIISFVNDKAVFIISGNEFIPNADSKAFLGGGPLAYIKIYKGLTLINTDENGITSAIENDIFWGTSSNSLKFQGYDASDFILKSDTNFQNLIKFSDQGYFLGDNEDLQVSIDVDGETPLIVSKNNFLKIKTSNGVYTPLTFVENNILPGVANSTNIGSLALPYNNIYATTFNGTFIGDGSALTNINPSNLTSGLIPIENLEGEYNIDITGNSNTSNLSIKSNSLFVVDSIQGDKYRPALIGEPFVGIGDTIAVRDPNGDLNSRFFNGTALTALFADLAEKYLPDQPYDVGTVVAVGGSAEVTACKRGDRAFGAVSANPAFRMNETLEGGIYIALKGRVPIKVVGMINKGDKLIAAENGCAAEAVSILRSMPIRASTFPDTFAIALETNSDPGVKLVECIIL